VLVEWPEVRSIMGAVLGMPEYRSRCCVCWNSVFARIDDDIDQTDLQEIARRVAIRYGLEFLPIPRIDQIVSDWIEEVVQRTEGKTVENSLQDQPL